MSNQLLSKSKTFPKEFVVPGTTISLQKIPVEGYEEVFYISDQKTGLQAYIAIHNTTLGPALGGTRIYPYTKKEEALEDALRLSRGMTYKSAVAGVGLGGGKSVIMADPKTEKTPELLRAFGKAVNALEGKYICAEDVGCTTEDAKEIRKETQFVVGLPHEKSSGDPGFFTAWGVFRGMQSISQTLFGTDCLEGVKVAIQGLGNVGRNLASYLFWSGAELILADIDPATAEKFGKKFGAKIVSPKEILSYECDIFAPCAMGGVLNKKSISELRCKAIAGAANNQLLLDSDAELLKDLGILYAPDFVINAGGLLNVAQEIEKEGYSPARSRDNCRRIYDTLLSIYKIAKENKESTHAAAMSLGDYRIQYGVGERKSKPVFHH